MIRARHSSALVLCFVSSFILTTGAATTPQAAPDSTTRITAAANITLRAAPSAASDVVAQVPLGTEVKDAGPEGLDKTWVRVTLPDGRDGWLQASLTRRLDPVWRWPVFDEIIASRLGRKGDGFAARAELLAFIERVAPEYTDADGRARIELSRMRALESALAAIPFRSGQREPYASWLAARRAEVVYDEPGGRWMPAPDSIWALHARHARSAAADDIAWFAVTNGLPGECEGHLPCYLVARNRLQGEYLRRHPNGRRAAEAVDVIRQTADTLTAPPIGKVGYAFDRATDCRDVVTSLDALASAIKGTGVAQRDTALASLAAVRKPC